MDQKEWMHFPRFSIEYRTGLEDFLDNAFAKAAKGNAICCPCKDCVFRYWYRRDIVYDHLVREGFTPGYTNWHFHGEGMNIDDRSSTDEIRRDGDDINELLHSTFRDVVEELGGTPEGTREGPNMETKKFFRLVEEGQQELYPGCKSFSKLSFTIRLYLFKCLHGISDAAFTFLLELLKEAFPDAKIPSSFNAAKRLIKDLGLDYERIHACPNDCMLFWGENKDAQLCHICGTSRWKTENSSNQIGVKKGHKIAAKVFRYFQLKPRLQRLYMCPKIADSMLWHDKNRPKDGKIRHPADGDAWKEFDSRHPTFAKEPRNVRLGLASDGFNPFRTMSIAHSTWPIVLSVYNLPPWQCMKPEFLLLSSIIPGPSSPGKNIDIYLQPLIKELKELWDDGIETFDAATNQSFVLRASLMWTISDFPAYAMLAGWVSKGKYACPICHYETCSQYLKHSRKTCYMNHRRFLDLDHSWRYDKKSFNGKEELGVAPTPLSGSDILHLLSNFKNSYGKSQGKQKTNSDNPWRKRSIFFELPYWEFNLCCHNLDVMHIEKNICDSILGTLLDIPGKTKDHINARLDLRDMGIRQELHPIPSQNNQLLLVKACFSMNDNEKSAFCSVMKNAKLPQGCASNISRCVDVNGKKISGYKSHDAHFIMQYLLQIAVKKSLPKHVAIALIRLSAFFRGVYNKVVKQEDLDRLQSEISEILCLLEMIFPPSFFDIMVHLPIHLIRQIRLGGPVQYSSMYPIERYLGHLKGHVRNRCRPEASIAEGYMAEECLTFCSRFLSDGQKAHCNIDCSENYDSSSASEVLTSLFPKDGHPICTGKSKNGITFTMDMLTRLQAHRYILFNCQDKEIEEYIKEHQNLAEVRGKTSKWARAQAHSQDFCKWFEAKVIMSKPDSEHILWLSKGPDMIAKRYAGYFINGYRFRTRSRDARLKTQNSGVTLAALTPSFASSKDQNPATGDVNYYGAIEDIIEVNFSGKFSAVLFKCVWFQEEKDDFGLLKVNFNRKCYSDDPFVLANQVHQVFYIQDPTEESYHYVIKHVPRDLFDTMDENIANIQNNYWREHNNADVTLTINIDDGAATCYREDFPRTVVDMPSNSFPEHMNDNSLTEDSDFDDTDWDWMDCSS